MTQYTELLWGSSDGTYPTSVLTKRWVTTNETVVACNSNSEAEGGFTFEHDWSVAARRLNSLDAIDGDANRANIELLARFQINEAMQDYQLALTGRASGAAASENAYVCGVIESGAQDIQLQIFKFTTGTFAQVAISSDILSDYVLGDWLYLRFRINGSDLKARIWFDGDPEPSAWSLETTDSGITGVGWGGISQFTSLGLVETDLLTIGTNGDAAPLAADTTVPIRISAAYAAVLRTAPTTGPVRISAAYAAVLRTTPTGPVRISAAYAAVLYSQLTPVGPIDYSIPAEWTEQALTSACPDEGDGSDAAHPIYIETAADLIAMDVTKHHVLVNDIDISATNWTPLGAVSTPMTGSLDGLGFKITGLNSTYVASHFGLIYSLTTGTIRRLGVVTTSAGITGQSSSLYSGVIVGIGSALSEWLIEDCWCEGKIDTGGDRCGGLIGITTNGTGSGATLRRNRVAVEISGTIGARVGGVSGWTSGGNLTQSDNYFDSDVATTTATGNGGIGTAKTTTLMQQEATFNNFDFTDTWVISEGDNYPFLQAVCPATPIEWTQGIAADHIIPVEWELITDTPVASDHQIPIEWTAGLALDHEIPAEWTGSLESDHQIPAEWIATLELDYQIPVEWGLQIDSDHQAPVEWGLQLGGDHQIPILWDGSFATDKAIPAEWVATITPGDHIIPAEWDTRLPDSDHAIPAEWKAFIDSDSVIPVEWHVGFNSDHTIHIDWSGFIASDHIVPVEWGLLVESGQIVPAEWGLLVESGQIVPAEWTQGIDSDHQIPYLNDGSMESDHTVHIDWSGFIESDQQIRVEWVATVEFDFQVHIDWSGFIQQDYQIPIEWGERADRSKKIPKEHPRKFRENYIWPIEWDGGVGDMDSDHQSPIDWSGFISESHQIHIDWSGFISESHQIPVEWNLLIAASDHLIPIEWDGGLAADAAIPIEWAGFLDSDHQIPINWSGFIIPDHSIPIEWIADVPVSDHQIPAEWQLEIPDADYQIPAEWTAGLAADNQTHIDWTGFFGSDHQVPINWSGFIDADQGIPIDWGLIITPADLAIPIEWGGGIAGDASIPVEWAGFIDSDHGVPVEWIATFGENQSIPVEWALTFALQHQIPAEWGEGSVIAVTIPAEWAGGIAGDSIIPVEWVIATDPIFADHQIPIEWTQGLDADQEIPVDNAIAFVQVTSTVPLEWRLIGFQPFTPHPFDCLIWQADCSIPTFVAAASATRWLADELDEWQGFGSREIARAAPSSTLWMAATSDGDWRACKDTGRVWVADLPCTWTAEYGPTLWTSDAWPV